MNLSIKNRLDQDVIKAIPGLLKIGSDILASSKIVSPSHYARYFMNTTRHFLDSNRKNYLFIAEEKRLVGIALLRFMEWDSNFFKVPIGCIEYILGKAQEELLVRCFSLAQKIGIKILYVSVRSTEHRLIDAINALKFNFICAEMKGLIRKKDLPYLQVDRDTAERYELRKYKEKDYARIINIAEEITEDLNSKFSLNPDLPLKAKNNYYLEDIKNCCIGDNADNIFVAAKNNVAIGFVCYRYDKIFEKTTGNKMSFVVMGGISRRERRKNVARYLFTYSHRQILKESDAILWKAYLHNLAIIEFMLGRGFVPPFEIIYTFSKKL